MAVALTLTAMSSALPVVAASRGTTDASDRPFEIRYSANLRGNLTLIGNGNLSCAANSNSIDGDTTCFDAQNGSGIDLNNNDFDLVNVDIDADPSTINSTSANLTLPAGSTVQFAGLYWGAFSHRLGDPVNDGRFNVLLKAPGASAYATITANLLNDVAIPDQGNAYQGVADVTQIVKQAGAGTYTVANIAALTGPNRYAGWTLVVVYANDSDPQRNIVVYDGFLFDQPNVTNLSLPLAGFLTPPVAPVKTSIGLVVYDGDRGGIGNDLLLLNGTAISNTVNPAGNIFNSTISRDGVPVTDRVRNANNTFGIDIDLFNADNVLPTSATAATVVISASQKVLPGVVTFATQIFRPTLATQVVMRDLNGGTVYPGDELEYTVTVTNTGDLAADHAAIENRVPNYTTFVPGSLQILSSPVPSQVGAQSDAAGDDLGDVANGKISFRLGAGANASEGGSFAVGATAQVRFRLKVAMTSGNNSVIVNTAVSKFVANTGGGSFPLSDSAELQTMINARIVYIPLMMRDR